MKNRIRRSVAFLLAALLVGQLWISVGAVSETAVAAESVAITEENFPDAVFRQWLTDASHVNGYGADGVFTAEELAQIRSINVSELGISSLQGIEYFTALQSLSCAENRLTTLDVRQNRALTYLNCNWNRIAALDVSGLDQLIALYCENNYMTSLNLSGCTAMEIIYCRYNNLPEVDFSTNTSLKFIETFDNRLTEVDLSTLVNLEFVHLDHNFLTHLDLSKNTNLSPIGSGFVARNNQLDTLTLPVREDLLVDPDVYAEQDPKVGFERVEWYADPGFTQPVTEPVIARGQTLYAKWLPNDYTIYFSANGGSGTMPPQPAVWGQQLSLPANQFTRTGYVFAGWEDKYGDGSTYTDGQLIENLAGEVQADRVTLYARWTPITYTVAFDANGGNGEMPEQTLTYDRETALPACTMTGPDSWEFAGWSLSANGNVRYPDGAAVWNLASSQDQTVTLYAIWREPIANKYLSRLEDAFAGYHAGDYTAQDWQNLVTIRQNAADAITAAAQESQMQQLCQQALEDLANVPTCTVRAQAVTQSWQQVYQQIIGKTAAQAVDEQTAAELEQEAMQAADGLNAAFVAQHTDLKDLADQQQIAKLAAESVAQTRQSLVKLAEAATWASHLDGLSTQALSEVTSASYGAYERACSEAQAYSAELTQALQTALQTRAQLAQAKQQAVTRLQLSYSAYDLSQYSAQGQQKLEDILQSGLTALETAESEASVLNLLEQKQKELAAVPDRDGESFEVTTSAGQTILRYSVQAQMEDKTASGVLSEEMMEKMLRRVLQETSLTGTAPVLRVDLESEQAETVQLTLPVTQLKALGDQADAQLVFHASLGELTLDAAACRTLANQSSSETVMLQFQTVGQDALTSKQQPVVDGAPVFGLSWFDGDHALPELGTGSIQVSVLQSESGSAQAFLLDAQAQLQAVQIETAENEVRFVTAQPGLYALAMGGKIGWQNPFVDVNQNVWYYSAVRYVQYHKLMVGNSSTVFSPEQRLTRAQLAQMLYSLAGKPASEFSLDGYTDVVNGAWYVPALRWAVENKILAGYGDGLLKPDTEISREQLVTLFFRYAAMKGQDTDARADLSGYTDQGTISRYALPAMQWASAEGLISGVSDTLLAPQGTATRAQAAAILMRYCISTE